MLGRGGGVVALLVGRESELEALQACLAQTTAGSGTVVLLEGAAGIGKTRLLEETLRQATELGVVVLQGAAEELEQSRPFGALAAALRTCPLVSPGVAELAAAASSGRGGPASTAQFHVIDEVLDHLEELASSTALVVALDDLQWADPATVLTAHALIRRIPGLPVALLLGLRPLPRGPDLEGLVETALAGPAYHLRLEPLDDASVQAMLAHAVHAEPGPQLQAEVQRAGGNPFYVEELLRALSGEHAITVADGRAEVHETDSTATLGSTILRHLRFLADDTLRVLELAAVLGASFTTAELAAFSNRPVEGLLEPLRQAVEADVLRDREEGFVFRHDLVREALYRRLPQGIRSELHVTAGRALASLGAPSAKVATHFAVGAAPGDAEAVSWLRRAAAETAMSASGIAERFARRAIELAGADDPGRDELSTELVTLLVTSGQAEAAGAVASEILDREHDPALDPRLRFALGQAAFLLGRQADAIESMRQASRDPTLDEAERALVLGQAGMVRLVGADLAGADEDAREALELAVASGDSFAEAMSLAVVAAVETLQGRVTAAVATAERATELASSYEDTAARRLASALRDPHMFRGMALMDADRLDDAAEAFRTGARLTAERGVAGGAHFYHYWLGSRHYHAGAWDDAAAELETGLALAEETENRRGALAAHALLSLMALHRDELDMAAGELGLAERGFAESGPDYGFEWMLLGRALLTEAHGDLPAACTLLTSAWEALAAIGTRYHYRTIGPELVRQAVLVGDRDLAAGVTHELVEHAAEEHVATIEGAARRCQGLVADDPGLLLEAVEAFRRSPRLLETAVACEDAAVAASQGPAAETARDLLHEALELYGRLGARRDAARAAARMRPAGIRPGVRGPRPRAASGWGSLTPTEERVVELVAEGLSNPEIGRRLFISRRTVQTHLSHVFAKLSLSSRVELAAEFARAGAAD